VYLCLFGLEWVGSDFFIKSILIVPDRKMDSCLDPKLPETGLQEGRKKGSAALF
jgi:hypothetical protein